MGVVAPGEKKTTDAPPSPPNHSIFVNGIETSKKCSSYHTEYTVWSQRHRHCLV